MAASRGVTVVALVAVGILVAAAAEEQSFSERARLLRERGVGLREAGLGGPGMDARADWMDVQAALQEDAEAWVEIDRVRERIHAAGDDQAARGRLEADLAAYMAVLHEHRRDREERLRASLDLQRRAWDMNRRSGRAVMGDAQQRRGDELEAGLATIGRYRELTDGMLELRQQVRGLTAQVAKLKGQ